MSDAIPCNWNHRDLHVYQESKNWNFCYNFIANHVIVRAIYIDIHTPGLWDCQSNILVSKLNEY